MRSSNDVVTGEQTRYIPGGSGEEMVTISSISSDLGPTGLATPPASCPRAGDPNHEPDFCAVCVMAVRARAERKNR